MPGALVTAGTVKARSASDGRFDLKDVEKGARVAVSATNFDGASIASAQTVNVKLVPIPVTGTVTSSFTKKPLEATVTSGRVATKVDATGRFTLYGAGPADTLAISASGYQPLSVAITSERVVAAVLHPTSATVLAHDVPLIRLLFRNETDSWFESVDAGVAQLITDAYPGLGLTPAACRASLWIDSSKPIDYVPPDYQEEFVLDASSIARDDGWRINWDTPLKGQVPKGRIYSMNVTSTVLTKAIAQEPASQVLVHVTIIEDHAYDFTTCPIN